MKESFSSNLNLAKDQFLHLLLSFMIQMSLMIFKVKTKQLEKSRFKLTPETLILNGNQNKEISKSLSILKQGLKYHFNVMKNLYRRDTLKILISTNPFNTRKLRKKMLSLLCP